MSGLMAQCALRCRLTYSCHEFSFLSPQVCAARCTLTIMTKLCCSHVKAVYYASVYSRCQLLYCIFHVLLTCLFEMRMNDKSI